MRVYGTCGGPRVDREGNNIGASDGKTGVAVGMKLKITETE